MELQLDRLYFTNGGRIVNIVNKKRNKFICEVKNEYSKTGKRLNSRKNEDDDIVVEY